MPTELKRILINVGLAVIAILLLASSFMFLNMQEANAQVNQSPECVVTFNQSIHNDKFLILIAGINTNVSNYSEFESKYWPDFIPTVENLYEGVIYFSYDRQNFDSYSQIDSFQDVKTISAPLLRDLINNCRGYLPNATFDIVGHSLGGYIALQYTKQNTQDIINTGDIDTIIGLHSPFNGAESTYLLNLFSIPTSGAISDLNDDYLNRANVITENENLATLLGSNGITLKNHINIKDQVVRTNDGNVPGITEIFDINTYIDVIDSHNRLKDYNAFPEVGSYIYDLLNNGSNPNQYIELCNDDPLIKGIKIYKDRHCRPSDGVETFEILVEEVLDAPTTIFTGWDDNISSIKVANGWSVKVKSAAPLQETCISSSQPVLENVFYDNTSIDVDNSITIFEVFNTPDCSPSVIDVANPDSPTNVGSLVSRTSGGYWTSASTWNNVGVPGADDIIEITGRVTLIGNRTVKGVIIYPGAELIWRNSSDTLTVTDGVINYGTMNIRNLRIQGDIYNAGSWTSAYTYLETTKDKLIHGPSVISGNTFVEDDFNLTLDGLIYSLSLRGNSLNVTTGANHALTYLLGNNGQISSSNPVKVQRIHGTLTSMADFANVKETYGNITVNNIDFIEGGRFNTSSIINANTVTFTDSTANTSTATQMGGVTINGDVVTEIGARLKKGDMFVNGNFTHNGEFDSTNGNYVNVYVSGDIINNGTWKPYYTYLTGTNSRTISGSTQLQSNFIAEDSFDLSLNNSLQSLNLSGETLTLLDTTGGYITALYGVNGTLLGNMDLEVTDIQGTLYAYGIDFDVKDDAYGTIHANTIRFKEGGQFNTSTKLYANTVTFYDGSSSPTTASEVLGATIYGDVLIETDAQLRRGNLYVYGDVTNNGVLTSNYNKKIYMYVAGDITNNGSWGAFYTYLLWEDDPAASNYEISFSNDGITWDPPINRGTNTNYNLGSGLSDLHWRQRAVVGGVAGTWNEYVISN